MKTFPSNFILTFPVSVALLLYFIVRSAHNKIISASASVKLELSSRIALEALHQKSVHGNKEIIAALRVKCIKSTKLAAFNNHADTYKISNTCWCKCRLVGDVKHKAGL